MRAIVCESYGPPDVLRLEEVTKPAPKREEIVVKILATAVNSADWRMRKGEPFPVRFFFGLTKPRRPVLGGVFAGVVEEIGQDVSGLRAGDAVFGVTGMTFGAYADYISLPEKAVLTFKPPAISFEEAASVPFGGLTALHFLKKANIESGQNVLIYGASGAVGTAAVQLAKHYGALVTGVCSTENVALVRSLGADHVIDYKKEDFTASDEQYDMIFDTVGKASVLSSQKRLKKNGRLILGASGLSQMWQSVTASITTRTKVISGVSAERTDHLITLKELLETGAFRPVIDRCYPLEKIVEAHRYVEKGHKKGNVVITMAKASENS
ncbi:NAD(P)-dependent alcohol dehydrogenase [Alkalihalobacillus oceani]|uniref:NAD(P)-dependent alcohol dehydrogenase n=1 Tax=Halalkalibacter oceani TaxID=1653776 RepID=A0A9X2DRW0_9BACI|nr:NAD(P)-dependent alcohol dehydrogenase [Halalkalibacter oceani]